MTGVSQTETGYRTHEPKRYQSFSSYRDLLPLSTWATYPRLGSATPRWVYRRKEPPIERSNHHVKAIPVWMRNCGTTIFHTGFLNHRLYDYQYRWH